MIKRIPRFRIALQSNKRRVARISLFLHPMCLLVTHILVRMVIDWWRVTDGYQIIGQGFRWRHQLVVGPFGPEGEIEFVDVVTPHIGGIVSFYQFEEGELHLVADLKGYTSHIIGSRNLDMAFAADLDGDKRIELLLPSQDLAELGVISRNPGGAEVERKIPVGGKLTTNLAAVTLTDGSLAVGVGREDAVLRLWLP